MDVQKAVQIALREWENIRLSLSMCGDIGELDSEEFIKIVRFEDICIIKNLLEMDNKLSKHGYSTQEAADIFAVLVRKAGERLGLEGSLPHIFGSGYSWVRTGWFNVDGMLYMMEEQKYITKQLFFFKLFFPMGGDFHWSFDSDATKIKLNLAFNKLMAWQDDHDAYFRDVRDYAEELLPLWRGLLLALGLPLTEIGKSYQVSDWTGRRLSEDFFSHADRVH